METKKLNEIAEIYNGVRLERYQTNTEKQLVIKRKSENNTPEFEYIDVSKDIDQKYYSKKEDIIILMAGQHNVFKLKAENVIIPMYYSIIRVKEEYNSDYIFYLLKNKLIPNNIEIITEGTTLKIIKEKYLKEMKIPILPPEKQEKYGNIMNLIEEKIQLEKKSIELNEKIQKFLINNMEE